jgi:hypothetical protein
MTFENATRLTERELVRPTPRFSQRRSCRSRNNFSCGSKSRFSAKCETKALSRAKSMSAPSPRPDLPAAMMSSSTFRPAERMGWYPLATRRSVAGEMVSRRANSSSDSPDTASACSTARRWAAGGAALGDFFRGMHVQSTRNPASRQTFRGILMRSHPMNRDSLTAINNTARKRNPKPITTNPNTTCTS